MARPLRFLLPWILVAALWTGASADVPRTLTVQGQVLTSGGAPASSPVTVVLKLYATETATQALYSQSLGSVVLQGGVFDAALGPLPDGLVESASSLWLETVADGAVLPRHPLRSVPWAIVAQRALVAQDVTCTGCIGASDVQFLYAASASVGGSALDVECGPACIGAAEIEDGAVKSSHLQAASVTPDKLSKIYAGADTAGGPAKDLACTGCVAGAEIEANATLPGNVKTSGSLTACTAGAAGCGIVIGAAALVPPGDGWVDLQVTEGLRVRGPGGSGYRPIVFGGGTSTGSLTVQGGLTTSGSVGVGTTTPQEKLHVAGNLRVDGYISSKNVREVIWSTNVAGSYSLRGIFDTARTNGLSPGLYDCVMRTDNGAHWMGYRFTAAVNYYIGWSAYTHYFHNVYAVHAGTGGCSASITSFDGGSGAFYFQPGNCFQTIYLVCSNLW